MRIAVYAIALNEIRHVQRFLSACAEADVIVVADTGSSDGTVAALQAGGARVHTICVRPWRFDDARNASLALVPADIDLCFCLDLDEVPAAGWRNAIARGWTAQTTMGRYRAVQSHLPDGSPAVEMSGAKLHVRFGYRWRHMCHEVLVPDRLARPVETWLPDLRVDHWPDNSKPRSTYLGLLEAAVAEAPDEPRDVFLLGRDYMAVGRWDDGERLLRRYLTLAGQRWPQQRATAWRRLAKCRVGLGDHTDAVACLLTGLQIAPDLRDLWLDLAEVYAAREEWAESLAAAQRGLALPIKPGGVANDHGNAGGRPYYRASLAAWHLGHLADAQELAALADAKEPGHAVYAAHRRRVG